MMPDELAVKLRENPDLLKVNVKVVYPTGGLHDDVEIQKAYDSQPPKKSHPHDALIQQIVELARLKGWRVMWVRPGRTTVKGKETYRTTWGADGKGFPDLLLARDYAPNGYGDHRILFWEIKCGHDRLRPEQAAWLELLGGRVIRETDWQFIKGALR